MKSSPRSPRQSAQTFNGCRSWTTCTRTSTKRSGRPSPTRPTQLPACRHGRTPVPSSPKIRASRSPDHRLAPGIGQCQAPNRSHLEGGHMSTLVNAAPEVATAAPRRARLTAAKRRQYGAAYVLVLPFFLVFVAMVIVPLLYAGYLSLFRKRLIGGTSFAGAENYVKALTDPLFLSGVGRMAIFLVIQV